MAKKSRLGKGLGALISESSTINTKSVQESISNGNIAEIDIDKIDINPFQPRLKFEEDALNDLRASIKELGIIQPITLRKLKDNKFQLISGERRLRASKMAGLKKIPAFIREANDQEMLEFALVENIQREDLNSIEIAITYKRLMDECKLTQEKLSERTAKRRSTVANYLRLLTLSPEIQAGLRAKKITMGHARALISVEDPQEQLKVFYQAVSGELSVRKTEEIVKEINTPKFKKTKKNPYKVLDNNYKSFQSNLSEKFSAKIDLKIANSGKGKGKLVINFKSEEELQKIIEMMGK